MSTDDCCILCGAYIGECGKQYCTSCAEKTFADNPISLAEDMARKYAYQPLPKDVAAACRAVYRNHLPPWLNLQGDAQQKLYTPHHTLITTGYERIVIGDYGAFIEFRKDHHFVPQRGQEYRIDDTRYTNQVKYVWLTVPDGSGVKIYLQKKKVPYADYRIGFFYVSPYDVRRKGGSPWPMMPPNTRS